MLKNWFRFFRASIDTRVSGILRMAPSVAISSGFGTCGITKLKEAGSREQVRATFFSTYLVSALLPEVENVSAPVQTKGDSFNTLNSRGGSTH